MSKDKYLFKQEAIVFLVVLPTVLLSRGVSVVQSAIKTVTKVSFVTRTEAMCVIQTQRVGPW